MKLGLGTAQLGLDYGIANRTGKPDNADAMAILRTAAQGGVEYFDTASAYGDSEEIIGGFIKESGFKPKLCSKFTDCASAKLELQESLKRLGVGKLDYFLLHRPEQVFLPMFSELLESFRQEPTVGKVGVSVYDASEIEESLKHDVKVIQIPFNIIDSRFIRSGLLERAKSQGVELHARSIYLQGLLITDTPQKPTEAGKYLKLLDSLATGQGISVKELCFLYVRDCAYIDRFFIGCETVGQVEENLALYKLPKLTKEFINRVPLIFADVPDEIVNPSLW